jgi:serine O-acetyltransferase
MSFIKDVYSDYRRCRATGDGSWIDIIFFHQGFWATCIYRLAKAVRSRIQMRALRMIPSFGLRIVEKMIEIVTSISLPSECEIGPGLYVGHFGPLILNSQVRIGRNCNLSQGVTIGVAGRGDKRGSPILGDRVYVGPNAILIGKITIGNDAAVGAGAIVTKSVPPGAVVAGNPARILSYKGSFDFVRYDGMDSDPERIAAMEALDPGQTLPLNAESA